MVTKKRNKKRGENEGVDCPGNPFYSYEPWLGSVLALLVASIFGIVNFHCLYDNCKDGILAVAPGIEFFIIFMTVFIGFAVGWITHITTHSIVFKHELSGE